MRFAIAGGTVAVLYVGFTTILASVVGLPFQAALAIGLCGALVVHFTLQRLFVWSHHDDFALPLHHQLGRYIFVTLCQYAVTAASTAILPAALGLSTEFVYLATVVIVIGTNFVVFRHGIFHARQPVDAPR